jgi:hypothetical protein
MAPCCGRTTPENRAVSWLSSKLAAHRCSRTCPSIFAAAGLQRRSHASDAASCDAGPTCIRLAAAAAAVVCASAACSCAAAGGTEAAAHEGLNCAAAPANSSSASGLPEWEDVHYATSAAAAAHSFVVSCAPAAASEGRGASSAAGCSATCTATEGGQPRPAVATAATASDVSQRSAGGPAATQCLTRRLAS